MEKYNIYILTMLYSIVMYCYALGRGESESVSGREKEGREIVGNAG